MSAPSLDGTLLLERLQSLPGGRELLDVAESRRDVELVGGAVRDLVLERQPRELDVVVASEQGSFTAAAAGLARELADALERAALAGTAGVGAPVQLTIHERFGTAAIVAGQARIDVATRRAERYVRGGALPEVWPGDAEQDLTRRDFTVNAMTVALGGRGRGAVRAVEHSLEDLERRELRVLHPASFRDDPTRLLRLCRYATRLDFDIEQETGRLARQAVDGGALASVSGARVGAEMKLLLAERDGIAALVQLDELGALGALTSGDGDRGGLSLRLDRSRLAAALRLLEGEGRRDLLTLASLLDGAEPAAARDLLEEWEYTASDRDVVLGAARDATGLASRIAAAPRRSQLVETLSGVTPEAVALAAAGAAEPVPQRASEWLRRLRRVRLEIDGSDLLSAGVEEGPDVGLRLAHVLALRLDGELGDGRDAELEAALSAGAAEGAGRRDRRERPRGEGV